MTKTIKAYRGSILHFLKPPKDHNDSSSYQYFEDGLLVISSGKITALGNYKDRKKFLPKDATIIDYSNYLITPGFIDTHIHYAQTEIIASYGQQLLEWLNTYVFPAERKYDNKEYAENIATFFLDELLNNGTTTAVIYSTVHKNSADVLFTCANKLNMRIITGKTMMNRNAPDYLLDTVQSSYDDSKDLIAKWHNKNRLLYAVTPRFAPTSSEEQLEVAAQLLKETPAIYMQTHLAENKHEVKWVKELYPWSKDYTDVYDHYGLLSDKSIFGHGIYLSDREFRLLAETKSVIAWCPTSNFFLGSGVFNLHQARHFKNRINIGTDVGGGTSFSMLQTIKVAYKAAAISNASLSPLDGFYLITLGNASALNLDDKIGNFEVGKEADFVVLDLNCTKLLAYKNARANSLEEKLFNLAILGDDRVIKATYILGECKYHDFIDQKATAL